MRLLKEKIVQKKISLMEIFYYQNMSLNPKIIKKNLIIC